MKKFKREHWGNVKHKIIQLLGGLVMEKNDAGHYVVSMGRVAFWMAFFPALYVWCGYGSFKDAEVMKDVSPNHITVLLWLLGYNLGKHAVGAATSIFSKNGSDTTSITETTGGQ